MAQAANEAAVERRPRFFGLSRNVFIMGVVSFLTDVSSEMTLTILPLFLANVLGVTTTLIGVVEGVSESTATGLKVVSGWLSDRLRKRKTLAVLGYGISAVAKPFLYLADAWGAVLAIRFSDRVGKGVRTSPRDALVADSSEARTMGRSFGFHRAMDSSGAVVGLAAAAIIVFILQRSSFDLTRHTYQVLVLVAAVPAFVAVALLWRFVREVAPQGPTLRTAALAKAKQDDPPGTFLDRQFLLFVGVMVLFTLGNSSDAFLVLRAQNLGLSVVEVLLLLVVFNVVYAGVSGPAGALSDRLGRKRVIVGGWTVYALIYLGFALAGHAWQVWALFALYGLYYGSTEGVARAFVADRVASAHRGTAYGIYHGAVGLSILPASITAGALWQAVDPAAPFVFGAALAGLAAVGLLVLVR